MCDMGYLEIKYLRCLAGGGRLVIGSNYYYDQGTSCSWKLHQTGQLLLPLWNHQAREWVLTLEELSCSLTFCELSPCLLLHPGLAPTTHTPIRSLPAALDHSPGFLGALSGLDCPQAASVSPHAGPQGP